VKGMKRMQVTWRNWCIRAVRAVGVVAALAACGPAHAFYWYNWPGSGLPKQPTLLPPKTPDTTGTPPVVILPVAPPEIITPGSGGPTPPVGPPVVPPGGPPTSTPEPATGLLGLAGLGVVAAVRRWQRSRV
jgi:MYXO-CTERM domain-containing protein